MATVTINIEGDIDEVVATIRGMAGQSAAPPSAPATAVAEPPAAAVPPESPAPPPSTASVMEPTPAPAASVPETPAYVAPPPPTPAPPPAPPTTIDPNPRPRQARPQPTSAPAPATWNVSYVHTFWRNLSDTAKNAMIQVSQSPAYTQPRAQLMDTLALSQKELSGSLSSQGHSLNRLKRRRGDVNLPRPLTYNKNSDAYMLDRHFAEALVETGLGSAS